MIMPVTVLSVSITAPLLRYARSSMLEVLGQDYVNSARAKGAARMGGDHAPRPCRTLLSR